MRFDLYDKMVNVSDSMEMHCEADGTPIPSILWYKNNKLIEEVSGMYCYTCISVLSDE